ncbi:tyrosine-protein phosphatase [Streptomyces sp. NPDC050392]|uniref:tyrosine-protein phosphatase n=1 Tax=Streptomyces sp. NPDC050392 TaxID=3155782 RepID=UPI003420FDC0
MPCAARTVAGPQEQRELCPSMAEHAGRPVAAVLRQLSADDRPVLVHCASVKDRTGVVVALVPTPLGASEAETVADFVPARLRALGAT